jgi:hypothetical protein
MRCDIGVVLIFYYKLSFCVIIVYSSFIIFVKFYYYRGSFRSVAYYIILYYYFIKIVEISLKSFQYFSCIYVYKHQLLLRPKEYNSNATATQIRNRDRPIQLKTPI